MKIAHFAPFAPQRTGLYETTRDMIAAERMAGHTSELFDLGVEGKRRVGATDPRGTHHIVTRDYEDIKGFDLFVSHSDMYRAHTEDPSGPPVVQICHGRPLMSFRSSQDDPKQPVYQLYDKFRNNPRWKRFITLWPEYVPYWEVLFNGRVRALEAPCDVDRFKPEGKVRDLPRRGKINVLIADVTRSDMIQYHLVHGAIAAKKLMQDEEYRVHLFAMPAKPGPWQYILNHMGQMGILGEVYGHAEGFDSVLRAVDIVATSHTIATRIVREALSVGKPVVAPVGNRHAQFVGRLDSPDSMGEAIHKAADALHSDGLKARIAESVGKFDLEIFGREITKIYREAVEA